MKPLLSSTKLLLLDLVRPFVTQEKSDAAGRLPVDGEVRNTLNPLALWI